KAVVAFFQERDGFLKIVTLFPRHAKTVGLDGDLHLHLAGLDVLDDFLGRVGFDAGLDADFLARAVAGSGLDLSLVEALERDAALGKLALEHFDGGLDLEVVGGFELERLVDELDGRLGAFEVVALLHFFQGLAERVVDFMPIDLGDYVERRHRLWSEGAGRRSEGEKIGQDQNAASLSEMISTAGGGVKVKRARSMPRLRSGSANVMRVTDPAASCTVTARRSNVSADSVTSRLPPSSFSDFNRIR